MKTKTRMALDEILSRHPDADLTALDWQVANEFSLINGPWLLVGLQEEAGENVKAAVSYAVWKETGAVYDYDGFAVADDPFWEPEDGEIREMKEPDSRKVPPKS